MFESKHVVFPRIMGVVESRHVTVPLLFVCYSFFFYSFFCVLVFSWYVLCCCRILLFQAFFVVSVCCIVFSTHFGNNDKMVVGHRHGGDGP